MWKIKEAADIKVLEKSKYEPNQHDTQLNVTSAIQQKQGI